MTEPRPYRDLSELTDTELEDKRAHYQSWLTPPIGHAKQFARKFINKIEAEQRHRELERADNQQREA